MPNVNISIYLTDEEIQRYLKDKEAINAVAREMVKKRVQK